MIERITEVWIKVFGIILFLIYATGYYMPWLIHKYYEGLVGVM